MHICTVELINKYLIAINESVEALDSSDIYLANCCLFIIHRKNKNAVGVRVSESLMYRLQSDIFFCKT